MFSVHCSTFDVQRSMFNVHCSTFDVQRSTFSVRRSAFDVRRSLFSACTTTRARERAEGRKTVCN